MPYLPPPSYENLWVAAPSTIEQTSLTLISKSSKIAQYIVRFFPLYKAKGKKNRNTWVLSEQLTHFFGQTKGA